MKKSTLLTVASVGAVALTSAMTFAAWDTLSATSKSGNDIVFDSIEVKAPETFTFEKSGRDLKVSGVATATIDSVDLTSVKDGLKDNVKLKLAPVVKEGSTTVSTTDYTIVVHDNKDNQDLVLDTTDSVYYDESLSFDAGTKNAYTVTITPNEALKGKSVSLEVVSELVTK